MQHPGTALGRTCSRERPKAVFRDHCGERPVRAVSSKGDRNTLIFLEGWSVKYETPSANIYTDKQKSEMWDRWQRGESMSSIGRRFDRASSSIFPNLAVTGGIRPPDRTRSRFALTLIEREEISRGLAAKRSFRSIARILRRSPSTIRREIGRNDGRQAYRAAHSDQRAWDRA